MKWLTLSLIRQFCSRQLWTYFVKTWKISKVENIVTKGEILHVLCNFFFCYYVFKKPSAKEASESVYMRERVKQQGHAEKRFTGVIMLQHNEMMHLVNGITIYPFQQSIYLQLTTFAGNFIQNLYECFSWPLNMNWKGCM